MSASSGCCKDEMISYIKYFVKGLEPSKCSITGNYTVLMGIIIFFNIEKTPPISETRIPKE